MFSNFLNILYPFLVLMAIVEQKSKSIMLPTLTNLAICPSPCLMVGCYFHCSSVTNISDMAACTFFASLGLINTTVSSPFTHNS